MIFILVPFAVIPSRPSSFLVPMRFPRWFKTQTPVPQHIILCSSTGVCIHLHRLTIITLLILVLSFILLAQFEQFSKLLYAL